MNTDHWITAVLGLRKARRLVVFTGAGISAESGIPTFRDSDGFWQRFPPEKFANWKGLTEAALTDPRSVAEFVLNVVEPIAQAVPNAGHRAVAEFQRHLATTVITQNIDQLHQSAGSETVLEIHGSLLEIVHSQTGACVQQLSRTDLTKIAQAIRSFVDEGTTVLKLFWDLKNYYPLDWRGSHRPNLVLFGDCLAEPDWTQARQVVQECDVFLAVGTSGVVYPAAQLPSEAELTGALVITVDPQEAEGCWLQGQAGEVLPRLLHDAFGGLPDINAQAQGA